MPHLLAAAWVLMLVQALQIGGLVLAVATGWVWAWTEWIAQTGRARRWVDRCWYCRDGGERWWTITVTVLHTLTYTNDGRVRPWMRWWDRENFLVRFQRRRMDRKRRNR